MLPSYTVWSAVGGTSRTASSRAVAGTTEGALCPDVRSDMAVKKKPVYEDSFRPLTWIVRNAPKFVRRDSGGRDPRTVALAALYKAGLPGSPATVDAYLLGAKRARDTVDRYLEPVWESLRRMVGEE